MMERFTLNRYRDFNTYLRELFGERVQKISLDAGLGCPNRDGTISHKGCIFCDDRGSGTGAMIYRHISIDDQITEAKEYLQKRYGAKKFIAYFQSFSNTYGPLSKLRELYDQALAHENIVGLSVATRPDCVDSDVLDLLQSYGNDYLVWIEYGLQSAHDSTLQKINRGHDIAAFEKGVFLAHKRGINICAHIILGLPGEDRRMMLETARFLGNLPLQGVKIHLLYVNKGTSLASLYQKGEFRCLERPEYVELVVDVLELLPPEMIVQRLTGDPVHSELMAPDWAKEKSINIRLIREALERRDTWQGRRYGKSSAGLPH
jgi:radical SAM protein (TIGR01212 family)